MIATTARALFNLSIALLALVACKGLNPSGLHEVSAPVSAANADTGACLTTAQPVYDFAVDADPSLAARAAQERVGDITPEPTYEGSELYQPTRLLASEVAADQCYASWHVGTSAETAFALAGGIPRYAKVRARVPHVASEAYARPRMPRASYTRPTADETAHLHRPDSTRTSRRQAIRKVETPDVMSAAAHLDLREPQKVFFFARMIKVAAEPGLHSAEDSAKAQSLMRKFAEQPIQINVFTKKVGDKVVIEHVECVDGNHRLAAGLVSGKWRSIEDVPVEFLDIRVNGARPGNRPNGTALKDLHWLPARISETPEFKTRFKKISAEDFEARVRKAGTYDAGLLAENEYFHVPSSYGAAGPSIAIRPEIPSSHPAMGPHSGVPMWQVVRRTLIRDGIVSPSNFED